MRRSDLVQHKEKEKATNTRTSQIVFGERQHLLRVLDSLEGTDLPLPRAQQERRALEELIHARTQPDQYCMGRKDWPGSQRGCQTGNARKTCEAGARNGLLFAPPDQRAS